MPLFKQLDLSNWTQPDSTSTHFWMPGTDGCMRPMMAEDWARLFLEVELSEKVPLQIRHLFDAARGACLYGWFFYPLYQLGENQLFRVADAAVTAKCTAMRSPKKVQDFFARLAWLEEQGVILSNAKGAWDGMRRLRNIASHPETQSLNFPGSILGSFRGVRDAINALFENDPPQETVG
jgi:hypothetical protein